MQGWNELETLEGRPGGGFDQAEDIVAGRLRIPPRRCRAVAGRSNLDLKIQVLPKKYGNWIVTSYTYFLYLALPYPLQREIRRKIDSG